MREFLDVVVLNLTSSPGLTAYSVAWVDAYEGRGLNARSLDYSQLLDWEHDGNRAHLLHITAPNLGGQLRLLFNHRLRSSFSKIAITCHDPIPHTYPGIRGWARMLAVRILNTEIALATFLLSSASVHVHSELQVKRIRARKTVVAGSPLWEYGSAVINQSAPKFSAAFVGSAHEYKGLADFVEAIAVMQEQRANLTFLLAGRGVDKYVGHDTGKVKSVDRFLTDDEMIQSMLSAKIVVLPYREATQSGILGHVMSLGIAVVYTDVGDLADLAASYPLARKVQPRAPIEIARALLELVDRPCRMEPRDFVQSHNGTCVKRILEGMDLLFLQYD